MKEPDKGQEVSEQTTGASAQFFVLVASFVVVIVTIVWRPWLAHPPAAPLRVTT